jgi:hypothetical protein
MKRYEYDVVNVSQVQNVSELLVILNQRGKAGWRRVDADLQHVMFERELADDEPGSDEPSGPVPLNEDVAFYKQDQPVANTDITH